MASAVLGIAEKGRDKIKPRLSRHDKSGLQLAVEAMDVVKAAGGTKFLIATEPVE